MTQEKIRVLVVDDELDYATALAERLRRRGFEVDAVFDGQSGLDKLGQTHFDVMLLDLKMPGVDGLEVLRRVVGVDKHVRAIMLTGHGTVGTGIDSLQFGAADFLRKPANIDELCRAIRAAAEQARQSETLQRRGG